MAITSAEIDNFYGKCMISAGEEKISARAIYDYCVSPFMVYCDKFGPEDKKDAITQYQELLFDQGKTHEIEVIKTTYPEAEKPEYETPAEGFKVLLEEMNKGVNILCGLPAFYLPEGLIGRFDVLEKQDTEPSIFGQYHYIVRKSNSQRIFKNTISTRQRFTTICLVKFKDIHHLFSTLSIGITMY